MQTLPPLFSAGLRHLFAGALLGAWLGLRHGRHALRSERAELGGAALVGGLLLAGGNGLVVLAERTVPSGLTALVVASVPLWIVVLRLVARDQVAVPLVAGVLVGFVGVAILMVPGNAGGDIGPLGLIMVLGASVCWALGTFASPRLRTPRDPFVSTAVQMLAGGAILVGVATAIGEPARADPSTFSTASLLAIGYLVVFGSLVAFSAYTWLLQHAPVSVVSTYAYVNPVVAVVLGAIVLSEAITPTMVIGAAIILLAVAFIVSRGESRAQRGGRTPPDVP